MALPLFVMVNRLPAWTWRNNSAIDPRFPQRFITVCGEWPGMIRMSSIARQPRSIVGIDMTICLMILMVAPAVTVVGYEMSGHRHQAHALSNVDVD
jgi:hypothetical protein